MLEDCDCAIILLEDHNLDGALCGGSCFQTEGLRQQLQIFWITGLFACSGQGCVVNVTWMSFDDVYVVHRSFISVFNFLYGEGCQVEGADGNVWHHYGWN